MAEHIHEKSDVFLALDLKDQTAVRAAVAAGLTTFLIRDMATGSASLRAVGVSPVYFQANHFADPVYRWTWNSKSPGDAADLEFLTV